jgi:ferric-dicitrate binding protein FerR (iron transport regulator)
MINDSLPRLKYLFDRYSNNCCTDSERQELMNLVRLSEYRGVVEKLIEREIEVAEKIPADKDPLLEKWRAEEIFQEILKHKKEAAVVSLKEKSIGGKKRWIWTAAAAVFILLAAVTYLTLTSRTQKNDLAGTPVPVLRDVKAPATANAVITLSDGRQIILDSMGNGTLARQGNTNVVKLADGQIVYNGKATGEMQYNVLMVPKGSKIVNITLSDGSRVWLNSASSLKYPVVFAGNERKVEITGEAYFEVAHNTMKPFKVQKGPLCVTVLGTHFNVNAYDDETAIKITLLEGAVKINKEGGANCFLKPGQQARVSSDIKIEDDVNMDEVMAWKEGKFQFGEATDIFTIMRQISRWYDVEVEYKGTVKGYIGGTVSRNMPASQVLKMLEMTGAFAFRIEGKKVIVEQK